MHIVQPKPRLRSPHMFLSLLFSISMFPLKILLVVLLLMAPARAETNITIDDTDPRIVYGPPGVWLFAGNVRPLAFSRTADIHIYYSQPSHKTDGTIRRILHLSSEQQHPSPSLLSTFAIYAGPLLKTSRRTHYTCTILDMVSRRCLHLRSFLSLSNPNTAAR